MTDSRRGFVPADEKEFNTDSQKLLQKAQRDILYLLEQGYPIKNASTFVGNHYLLSERQRLAVVRATAESNILKMRSLKQLSMDSIGKQVKIDGLNIIITLEVALSQGTLIHCMDKTIRDLAGLRGTYRLIDKTEEAIQLLGDKLKELKVEEALFYLDAPVSNTGRLKQKILELLSDYPYETTVELVNSPDVILEKSENVITSDAIILNKCISWYNPAAEIIREKLPDLTYVELGIEAAVPGIC
ncbi:MAG TPA: DUF434 domain-containing protein [Mobilitalea sp.]|nr:DUF434 domain-containing protein [Mobilitalea sp.]